MYKNNIREYKIKKLKIVSEKKYLLIERDEKLLIYKNILWWDDKWKVMSQITKFSKNVSVLQMKSCQKFTSTITKKICFLLAYVTQLYCKLILFFSLIWSNKN